MSQPQLVINISPAGTTKIEAVNCTGEQCIEASAPIEVVLGGVQKRDDKPERFQAPATTAQNIQRKL